MLNHLFRTLLCLVLLTQIGLTPLNEEAPTNDSLHRVALVVGISDYTEAPDLPNPANDARAIASELWESGYEVIELIDPDAATFRASVQVMADRLSENAHATFFYAGHGVQFGGENYLLASDAILSTGKMQDVLDYSLSANVIAGMLASSGAKLSIIILDACRNNPLEAVVEDVAEVAADRGIKLLDGVTPDGLAPILTSGSQEIMISYATAPGSVAVDGPKGGNSPFTNAILSHISEPDLEIGQLFRRVRGDVRRSTNNQQIPWLNTSLENNYFFRQAAYQPATGGQDTDTLGLLPPSQVLDQTFWLSAVSNGKPEDFQSYLEQFPEGRFVGKAQELLELALASPTGKVEIKASEFGTSRNVPFGLIVPKSDEVATIALPTGTTANLPALDLGTPDASGIRVAALPEKLPITRLGGASLAVGDELAQTDLEQLVYDLDTQTVGEAGALALEFEAGGGTVRRQFDFTATIDTCDLVVGYPRDPYRVGRGTRWELIRADLAIAACTSAVERYPDTVRFHALLSRAYRKAEQYDLATDWNRKAVAADYPSAVKSEGGMHRYGLGRPVNFEEAARFYRRAADLGDSGGFSNLGELTINGEGVEQDIEEGFRLLQTSADMGDDWAVNLIGRVYERGDGGVTVNYERAFEWYLAAAKMGSPPAKVRLSNLYRRGLGVETDPGQAFRWYESAAGQGWSFAQARLGRFYLEGELTERNEELALYWIRKSADVGEPEGQYWLARSYLDGDGVEQNVERGIALLHVTAARGHARSIYFLAQAYEKGEGVTQNLPRALDLYEQAVEAGYPGAARGAARGYRDGWNGTTDPDKVIAYLDWAGETGNTSAWRDLAKLYLKGDFLEADPARALEFTQKAADAGDSNALRDLAKFYAAGEIVPRDPDAAFRTMQQAAGSQMPWAWIDLGRFHTDGVGTAEDPGLGALWLAKAAVSGDAAAVERANGLLERLPVEALILGIGHQLRVRGEFSGSGPDLARQARALLQEKGLAPDDRAAVLQYLLSGAG